jgi:hypothetical protein
LCTRRSQIVVLSDLLDPDAGAVQAGARSLKARGHDVVFLQVLHEDERSLPFQELAWYESDESKTRVLADPQAVRAAYFAELASLTEGYRAALSPAHIPFAGVDTATDVADTLTALLRGPLARVRGSLA